MRRFKNLLNIFLILILLTSCKSILKLTSRNTDFEYIKNGEVIKIVIQSSRDKGFRYVVTDLGTIKELYESLSQAKEVKEKSDVIPDYVFEFHFINGKIIKYNYVAGAATENSKGNLYNEEKNLLVVNRIDNMIIKNLSALRKPRDFYNAYYGSIKEGVKAIRADFADGTLGIDLLSDKEMLKYQMSYDILNFSNEISNFGAVLLESGSDVGIVVKVQSSGYKSDTYRTILEVEDKISKKTKKYYVKSNYINGKWDTEVTGEKPSNW